MDPQEALRTLGLLQSRSLARDNEFYRLACEWLRLRSVERTDKQKYRADLEKWYDGAVEYLVKMNLEAIERGLIPNPLAPMLENQKSVRKRGQQSAFRRIINCLASHSGGTACMPVAKSGFSGR